MLCGVDISHQTLYRISASLFAWKMLAHDWPLRLRLMQLFDPSVRLTLKSARL